MSMIPWIDDAQPERRPSLLEMTLAELTAFLAELGQPRFRAKQLWWWIDKTH